MINITHDELKIRFNEYNEKYFYGKLKMPKLLIKTNDDGVVGKFRYVKNGKEVSNPKIYIAKFIDWSEEELQSYLIHEMIHYYVVFVLHYLGPFTHGIKFRKECKRIEKDYNIKIKRFAFGLNRKTKKRVKKTLF